MSWGIFLVTVFLAVITVVVIVAIWQVFVSQRGRATLTNDESYQLLVQRAAEAQRRTTADLTEVKQRVANIEKLIS